MMNARVVAQGKRDRDSWVGSQGSLVENTIFEPNLKEVKE